MHILKKIISCLCLISLGLIHYSRAQSIDKNATSETKSLYKSLQNLLDKGIMFGHQDDLAYGLNPDSSRWTDESGRSDIKSVTDDYPAVFGWELGGIEIGAKKNLDGVPFKKIRQYIQWGYENGGIITISWHQRNPVTGGSSWDSTGNIINDILPDGKYNYKYKKYLNNLTAFLKSLKGKNGEAIPVIFRPYHELTGNWFWWGKGHCTRSQIKELWRYTVRYLRDKKSLHNLLYAYSTGSFSSDSTYLRRYPGNAWVDIIGADIYQGYDLAENQKYIHAIDTTLSMLEHIAKKKNKIPALTEFGYNGLPDSTWWTDVLLKALQGHHISYALTWRNAGSGPDHKYQFYAPFKGQLSAPNFKKFYADDRTLFLKDIQPFHIYKTK